MKRFSILENFGLSLAGMLCKEDLSHLDEARRSTDIEKIIAQKLYELGIRYRKIVRVKQEHTNISIVLDSVDSVTREWSEGLPHIIGDAIITNLPGLVLTISVADCVPIFLFDPKNKTLGLVHAGREGTRKKIIYSALEKFYSKFNSSPDDILVLIGPSIGPCCYEVSPTLALQCAEDGLVVLPGNRIDLWSSSISQLREQGIPPANIFLDRECTSCLKNIYYSYRRGDKILRNFVIGVI